MKTVFLTLALISTGAQAQTITTPQGSYQANTSGSTTYVTQTARGSSSSTGVAVAVPVNVNPITGIGMIHGPSGSALVQRSGSTTTVIQTSKGR